MAARHAHALLSFRIAGRQFALDAERVSEVVRRPAVTRVPHAPPSLCGVASLRGQVLPVVSLRELLGVTGADSAGDDRLIVLGGGEPLALAVDEVVGLGAGDSAAGGLVETADGAARVIPLEELLRQAFSHGRRRSPTRPATDVAARAEQAGEATSDFLAFMLAGQPYALPLAQVREVVSVPAELVALPRTDAAMVGVALFRGALTPVVSARVLLGLPPAPLTATDRLIVTVVAGARIGLAADHVDAVLRASASSLGPVPKVLNRGAGEARVTAMLKTGNGGLISVLEPERLFAEESLAQILEDGRSAESAAERANETPQASQRFLVFQLADETYGMDIAAVEEVVMLPERLARAPRAPPYVVGVMSLRGAAVPIIDQRNRFGLGGAGAQTRQRVIIARIGDLVAGFAVDAVTQILELPSERLAPTPELTQDAARLFDRVAQVEDGGRVILLVNPRELLDRAERDLVAALAAEAEPG